MFHVPVLLGCLIALLSTQGHLCGSEESGEKQTRVLIVGCSEYHDPSKQSAEGGKSGSGAPSAWSSQGAENSARLLHDTFQRLMGIPKENIELLTGWPDDESKRPTRRNIIAALDRLAKDPVKDNRVIIVLIGHGSYQPDHPGDDADDHEPDGHDEIFLPADVIGWDGNPGVVKNSICDDELRRKGAAIRNNNARIWVILDCCHSDTGIRSVSPDQCVDPALLGVPAELIDQRPDVDEGAHANLSENDPRGLVALYASRSNESTVIKLLPIGPHEYREYSILSYIIHIQLIRHGTGITFDELYANILKSYEARQWYNVVPQIEGELDQRICGDGPAAEPLFLLHFEGKDLVLEAGGLHQMEHGTILEVYKPGRWGEESSRLGYVRVEEAGPIRSRCRPLGWNGFSPPRLYEAEAHYPCCVKVRSFGDHRLKLGIIDAGGLQRATGDLPAGMLSVLDSNKERIHVVGDPEIADWLLVMGQDRVFLCPAVDGKKRGVSYEVDSKSLREKLLQIFRYKNLLRLAGGGFAPPLDRGLSIGIVKFENGSESLVENGHLQRPGDLMKLLVDNRVVSRDSRIDRFDIWSFYMDANMGLMNVFHSERVSNKYTFKSDPIPVTDLCLGTEYLLTIAIPKNENDKDREVRLDGLAGPPLQPTRMGSPSADWSDVRRCLMDLAFGDEMRTRSTAEIGNARLDLVTLRTEWGPLSPPETRSREWTGIDPSGKNREPDQPAQLTLDAWRLGTEVSAWSSSGSDKGFDVLMARSSDGRTCQVLVDLDGETETSGSHQEFLCRLISERAFDAELVVHFEPARTLVFYDRFNVGTFDLVLMDTNGNGYAETGFILEEGMWKDETDLHESLLWTGHLDFVKDAELKKGEVSRVEVVQKLADLFIR